MEWGDETQPAKPPSERFALKTFALKRWPAFGDVGLLQMELQLMAIFFCWGLKVHSPDEQFVELSATWSEHMKRLGVDRAASHRFWIHNLCLFLNHGYKTVFFFSQLSRKFALEGFYGLPTQESFVPLHSLGSLKVGAKSWRVEKESSIGCAASGYKSFVGFNHWQPRQTALWAVQCHSESTGKGMAFAVDEVSLFWLEEDLTGVLDTVLCWVLCCLSLLFMILIDRFYSGSLGLSLKSWPIAGFVSKQGNHE